MASVSVASSRSANHESLLASMNSAREPVINALNDSVPESTDNITWPGSMVLTFTDAATGEDENPQINSYLPFHWRLLSSRELPARRQKVLRFFGINAS